MKNRTTTLLCAATIAAVQIVHAARFTVTNTNDSGAGSLRDAIATANNGDTINFSVPANSTVTLSTILLRFGKTGTATRAAAFFTLANV